MKSLSIERCCVIKPGKTPLSLRTVCLILFFSRLGGDDLQIMILLYSTTQGDHAGQIQVLGCGQNVAFEKGQNFILHGEKTKNCLPMCSMRVLQRAFHHNSSKFLPLAHYSKQNVMHKFNYTTSFYTQ